MTWSDPDQADESALAPTCRRCGVPVSAVGCWFPYCGQHCSTSSVQQRLARPAETFVKQESGVGAAFIKNDEGKARADLLPAHAVLAVARVLGFGARKYAPNNWRKCEDMGRYSGAALRHIFAYLGGERTDRETGEHHLAHAATCLLFIVDIETRGNGNAP